MAEVLAQQCVRCGRGPLYVGPMDAFGTCGPCASAIREQVAAALPALERDCDNLGAFHAWCVEHDAEAGA